MTPPRRVCIFCGGHGAAPLVRELVRHPGDETSLIINGYDNGLSTGLLRALVPGMLGPSDFRKNLTYHLDPDAPGEKLMLDVLEHRLPSGAGLSRLEAIAQAASHRTAGVFAWDRLPGSFVETCFTGLDAILGHLRNHGDGVDLGDCALPNLMIAGLYLELGDFNAAVDATATAVGTPVGILNVTAGENAFLIACKADGQILFDEADIVAPQSTAPIVETHLLRDRVDEAARRYLSGLPPEARRGWIAERAARISLNPRVTAALAQADIVVFAPGTQFSSLLPSYQTPGMLEALLNSQARTRCLLINIEADHDIRGFAAEDIVDNALAALGDKHNTTGVLTDVLLDSAGRTSAGVAPRSGTWTSHRGARIHHRAVSDPARPWLHHGPATWHAILSMGEDHTDLTRSLESSVA